MSKATKKVEYQNRTGEGKVWSGGFTSLRDAVRYRNSTWPQLGTYRVTTTIELVVPGIVELERKKHHKR
jgi:hypothetical protein